MSSSIRESSQLDLSLMVSVATDAQNPATKQDIQVGNCHADIDTSTNRFSMAVTITDMDHASANLDVIKTQVAQFKTMFEAKVNAISDIFS